MDYSKKVSAYIENLPETERQIAEWLREMILQEVPDITEKFSFGIPFYHYHGMFCYINYLKKGGGIELAFCRGKDLLFGYPELKQNGREMVAGLTIHTGKDYTPSFIKNLLLAAADWQQEAWKAKKPFVKTGKSKATSNK